MGRLNDHYRRVKEAGKTLVVRTISKIKRKDDGAPCKADSLMDSHNGTHLEVVKKEKTNEVVSERVVTTNGSVQLKDEPVAHKGVRVRDFADIGHIEDIEEDNRDSPRKLPDDPNALQEEKVATGPEHVQKALAGNEEVLTGDEERKHDSASEDNMAITFTTTQTASPTSSPHASPYGSPHRRMLSRVHSGPICISMEGPRIDTVREQDGVITWTRGPGYWRPEWLNDPSLDSVREMIKPHLRSCGIIISELDPVEVKFFADGMWNKLFEVSVSDCLRGTRSYILRLAMPVCPWFKTQSEVATMEYVRCHTEIPIPRVFAFDSSGKSSLGLEWILMEKMEGEDYSKKEGDVSFDARAELHRTVASWKHQLSQLKFDQIGSIYRQWDPSKPHFNEFRLGPIVDEHFTENGRVHYPVYRGPFNATIDYYREFLHILQIEVHDTRTKETCEKSQKYCNWWMASPKERLKAGEPEPEIVHTQYKNLGYLSNASRAVIRLLEVLPLFPSEHRSLEKGSTHLHHPDIHANNILVNDEGRAIALIDWEFIYTETFASVYAYPKFINDDDIEELEPWTESGPKPGWRLEEERTWEEKLLRDAYEKWFDEEGSEYLNKAKEVDEDLDELARLLVNEEYFKGDEEELVDRMKARCWWHVSQ
ncbi:hypothetical protein K402DRAFT_396116 [Aulographum hederae CBS 113979]|uniref:Aminoglycoside phosphotransferase domain-containing protein n=1 Tax=Aulographum hederae CBS 113979 TaxID=1176131 RepID=A0A6G1GT44_9PEZI|nr:hypothetical protein K402DRAFT_396116 [Aulographum hederae CBS 113979]